MMKCKNCGETLSKLDKDVCPFCGARKPLEGMEDVTQDITKAFSPIQEEKVYKPKSKIVTFILGILFGFLGVPYFYLKRAKLGFIQLGISLVLILGIGFPLYFSGAVQNALAFLIPYFVIEAIMIVGSFYALFSSTLKDGNGEFLK